MQLSYSKVVSTMRSPCRPKGISLLQCAWRLVCSGVDKYEHAEPLDCEVPMLTLRPRTPAGVLRCTSGNLIVLSHHQNAYCTLEGSGVHVHPRMAKVITQAAVDGEGRWCSCCVLRGQICLLYTSPSPRDLSTPRMPSSA